MCIRAIPKYVPNEIIKEYSHYSEGCIDLEGVSWLDKNDFHLWKKRRDILEQLIFAPAMSKVWRALLKREATPPANHHKVIVNIYQLMDAVFKGLEGGDSWQKITRSERVEEHHQLLGDIKSLAFKLEKYYIDDRVLSVLTEEECLYIQLQSYGIPQLDKKKVALFKEENHRDPSLLFIQDYSSPSLAEALIRLSKKLDADPPYQKAHPGYTKSKNGKLNLFIKTIAKHNMECYGKNLPGTILNLASVFFPDIDIGKDTVKNALRNQ